MFAKLDEVEARYEEVNRLLAEPENYSNQQRMMTLNKERVDLGKIVEAYRRLKRTTAERDGARELLESESDEEMREMAKAELDRLEAELEEQTHDLKLLLLPKDPYDDKNILLEIRAGTGGEEAALFAGDLFRMYTRFAEEQGWKLEVMSASETGLGGFKEVICGVRGQSVYSRLKYESGVHRVQRVPETEAQGRIHTSAATVAVLPEPDEVEVDIPEKDLRIDVMRSSGPGGQHVNKTESAVRITHLPTNIVVVCQDEKSQHKNKAKAMMILRARVLDKMRAEQEATLSAERKGMVGTGDRSERIRTYNFPQNRLTDHRINLTLYSLDRVLEGALAQVIDPLIAYFQAEALKSSGS
jgi:peptide chain release factor 1